MNNGYSIHFGISLNSIGGKWGLGQNVLGTFFRFLITIREGNLLSQLWLFFFIP